MERMERRAGGEEKKLTFWKFSFTYHIYEFLYSFITHVTPVIPATTFPLSSCYAVLLSPRLLFQPRLTLLLRLLKFLPLLLFLLLLNFFPFCYSLHACYNLSCYHSFGYYFYFYSCYYSYFSYFCRHFCYGRHFSFRYSFPCYFLRACYYYRDLQKLRPMTSIGRELGVFYTRALHIHQVDMLTEELAVSEAAVTMLYVSS